MPAPAGFLTALLNIKPINQTEITQFSLTYKNHLHRPNSLTEPTKTIRLYQEAKVKRLRNR